MKQNHFIQGKCQPLLQPEYTKYESEQQSCPCSTSYSPTLLRGPEWSQNANAHRCPAHYWVTRSLVSRPRPSRSLIWTSNPFFISDASTQAIFIVIALHDIFQVLHLISEQFTESVNITAKNITKVSEVAKHILYCSDKTTLPLRVFFSFSLRIRSPSR